jgi:serine/threonine-protein kinase
MSIALNPIVRDSFSGYRLRRIGGGGVGKVYQAQGPQGEGKVYKIQIKGEATRKRMEEEAKNGKELAGTPGIVEIDEFGEVKGQLYIREKLVPGVTLEEKLNRNHGKISPALAVEIMKSLAEVLKNMHDQGYCHCDIKPGNIMINEINEEGKTKVEVVLIDLGNVRKFSKPEGSWGITLSYSSPEQVRGEYIDQRSDIFAMGIVFLKILTGRNPFKGKNEDQTASMIQNEPIPYKLLGDKNISLDLSMIIQQMLEKDPEQRYQNCEELLKALSALQL